MKITTPAVTILMVGLTCGQALAAAPTTYLCISSQSIGFSFNQARKEWIAARFAVGKKYLIKRVTPDTIAEFPGGVQVPLNAAWAVWNFGNDKVPAAECEKDFNDNDGLFCESADGVRYWFDRKTGRYISDWMVGYITGAIPELNMPDGSNTPFLEIGTCSTI